MGPGIVVTALSSSTTSMAGNWVVRVATVGRRESGMSTVAAGITVKRESCVIPMTFKSDSVCSMTDSVVSSRKTIMYRSFNQ